MATTPTGLAVPAGTDVFDPDGHMRALGASLEGRIIVPVPNITARNALAAAVSPTPAEPLYVDRADAGPRGMIERTIDGTRWEGLAGIGTAIAPTLHEMWIPDPDGALTLYQDGGHWVLTGNIRNRSTGSISTTAAPLGWIPPHAGAGAPKTFPASFGGDGPWSPASIVVATDGTLTFFLSRPTASIGAGAFVLAVQARWLAKVA